MPRTLNNYILKFGTQQIHSGHTVILGNSLSNGTLLHTPKLYVAHPVPDQYHKNHKFFLPMGYGYTALSLLGRLCEDSLKRAIFLVITRRSCLVAFLFFACVAGFGLQQGIAREVLIVTPVLGCIHAGGLTWLTYHRTSMVVRMEDEPSLHGCLGSLAWTGCLARKKLL